PPRAWSATQAPPKAHPWRDRVTSLRDGLGNHVLLPFLGGWGIGMGTDGRLGSGGTCLLAARNRGFARRVRPRSWRCRLRPSPRERLAASGRSRAARLGRRARFSTTEAARR